MTVTSLGGLNGSVANGNDISLTVPAGGIAAGSFIFIFTAVNTNAADTTWGVHDAEGNTYTGVLYGTVSSNKSTKLFYCWNCLALTAGQTISAHNGSAGTHGFFISGGWTPDLVDASADPYQAAVSAVHSSSTTTTSPTEGLSGVPAANSFIVAGLEMSNAGTFTQDGTFSAPPDRVLASNQTAGGNIVSSLQKTWSPTFGTAGTYVGCIAAFKPPAAVAAGSWIFPGPF